MHKQRKTTIPLLFENIFETCKILISKQRKMQFLQSEWGPHSFHKKRISCKNRNWRFSLRKHSESWEETWGCLNFHCGTISAAQWEGKKKNHLQQDGRRGRQARTTHPERGKPGRSLVGEAREVTGKEGISQEWQGKFCSHLSQQRKTRRQHLWERLDQHRADTDESQVPFN